MKVRELIEMLSKLEQEKEIFLDYEGTSCDISKISHQDHEWINFEKVPADFYLIE